MIFAIIPTITIIWIHALLSICTLLWVGMFITILAWFVFDYLAKKEMTFTAACWFILYSMILTLLLAGFTNYL